MLLYSFTHPRLKRLLPIDCKYSVTSFVLPQPPQLAAPTLVNTADGLADLIAAAGQCTTLGVDTESNSLFAYFHQVCLIQITLPGYDYVVDPLAVDVTPLAPLFANPAIEKIFHAAENDILGLKRDYQFAFANVFDTMIAARILGWPQAGLAAILADRFRVHLNKSLQRADWGRRPLNSELLAYAQYDTHYLLDLRAQQAEELKAKRRWEEALESFARLPFIEWVEKPFDAEGFWNLPRTRELAPMDLAVLRQIYLWREQQARREDRPPFKVMDQRTLLEISRRRPASLYTLQAITGMTGGQIRRYGDAILQAIARGEQDPPPSPPRRPHNTGHPRPDPRAMTRFDALRAWRTDCARQRGVDPDVILTNDQLMTLARQAPATTHALAAADVMGPWKQQEYGPAILQVLAQA